MTLEICDSSQTKSTNPLLSLDSLHNLEPDLSGLHDKEASSEEELTKLMKAMGLPTEFSSTKSQKKRLRRKSPSASENEPKRSKNGLNLAKYWAQRYRLFSKFDEGIKLDQESWYSVTPEEIAKHIAERILQAPFLNGSKAALIVDGFCGAGGNTIQFALLSEDIKVLAIDIDPEKIALAKHNAKVYGVAERIEFVVGDFVHLCKNGKIKADVVFLSPPWGGPEYVNQVKYSLDSMTPKGKELFRTVQDNVSSNIAFLLPRNVDEAELVELASAIGSPVEMEKNYLNKKIKTVTAYFGQLVLLEEESSEEESSEEEEADGKVAFLAEKQNVLFDLESSEED